jgi:hypothetical protein
VSIFFRAAHPDAQMPARRRPAVRSGTPPILFRLSDDLLLFIASFLRTPPLSVACRRLRRILRGVHISCTAFPLDGLGNWQSRLQTVAINCPNQYHDPSAISRLAAALAAAPSLEELRLSLRNAAIGASHAVGFAALGAAPFLADLQLDLSGCHLGAEGAGALAAVAGAPRLTALSLGLAQNRLNAGGCSGLVRIAERSGLRCLTIDLRGNGLDDGDALSLAMLGQIPTLRSLHLLAGDNLFGPPAALSLAGLSTSPGLTDLTVDLSGNRLGPSGAIPLAGLSALPRLTALSLGLRSTGIGPHDAEALGSLSGCRSLETLRLDLGRNPLGTTTRPATLAHLRLAPWVTPWLPFRMDYAANGDLTKGQDSLGAGGLAALATAPNLRTLHLRLDNCHLPFRAVTALTAVAATPSSLRRLTLDLGRNNLGSGGVCAATAVQRLLLSCPHSILHLDLRENGVPQGDTTEALGWVPRQGHSMLVN